MRKVGSELISRAWGARALGLFGAAFALAPALTHAGAVPPRDGATKGAVQGGTPGGAPRAALGFVENKGQWNAKARFMGRGDGVTMWLQNAGVLLEYPRSKDSKSKYLGHAIEMVFAGSKGGTLAGARRNGTAGIFHGKTLAQGGKFGRVLNAGVYPGIDFVSYFDGKSPRYDFVVKPGAKPDVIRLGFKGAKGVRIVKDDTLGLGTVFGEQKLGGLFAYQTIDGKRVPVKVAFRKNADGEIGFALGTYDRSKTLVIDPLVYGTYFGGNAGFDEVRAIATDLTSGTYVTGYTLSSQFPINAGPFGFNKQPGRDAFLSKLQGDAFANDYSVYIGGDGDDRGDRISVDASGNVFVVGTTDSSDFPGTGSGGSPTVRTGNQFIIRFAPDRSAVLTPFPLRPDGTGDNTANAVVYRFGNDVDGDPAVAYLSGFGVPTPEGAAASRTTTLVLGGSSSGLTLDNVDPDIGSFGAETSSAFYLALAYDKILNTFVPNQSASGYIVARNGANVRMSGVAVDRTGNIYLNGTLFADGLSDDTSTQPVPTFDTTSGVYAGGRLIRNTDTFVRKLRSDGSVVFSSLLGGSANDFTTGFLVTRNVDLDAFSPILDFTGPTIAADPNGNVYILSEPESFDFPRTRNVVGPVFPANRSSVAVTKISDDGDEILYSSNLGVGGSATTSGISVDPRGAAYVTGIVSRRNLFNSTLGDPPVPNAAADIIGTIPTTGDAIRPTYTSIEQPQIKTDDAFLIAINGDATEFLQGTYIGGVLDEGVFAPHTDAFGDTFVFGWTDTFRQYFVQASTAGAIPTRYRETANMGPFITPGAFKAVQETTNQGLVQYEDNVDYGFSAGGNAPRGPFGSPTNRAAPFVINNDPDNAASPYFPTQDFFDPRSFVGFLRDGFILRYRLSLPLVTSLTLSPNVIPGGDPTSSGQPATSTGTITLSAVAPAGGATVTVTLDSPTVASFNPTSDVSSTVVNIAPGATTGTFVVYSRPVLTERNVQVRADYAGNVRVATLSVRPWLQSLTLNNSTTVGGGGDDGDGVVEPTDNYPRGTVRLEAVAPRPVTVRLSSILTGTRFYDPTTNTTSASNQGTVVVPTGQQTATFAIITPAVDATTSERIDALLLGVTRSQNLTLTSARLNRIEFLPSSVAAGSTTQGTVVLDGRAATARTIRVFTEGVPDSAGYRINGGAAATITVPANSDRATFTLRTGFENSNVTRTVTAFRLINGAETNDRVSGTLQVLAVPITSISLTPDPVESGGEVTGLVRIATGAPSGGAVIRIVSQNQALLPIANTVTIPGGVNFYQFKVQVGTNTTRTAIPVTVEVNRGDTAFSRRTTTVSIAPLTYSLAFSPATVFGGTAATGTITLARPQRVPVVFNIDYPADSGLSGPATVTVPAGAFAATFRVNTSQVEATTTFGITVRTGNQTGVSAGLTVRAIQIASLTLSRSIIRQRETTRLTITLDGAPSADTTISLAYSNGTLISFPPVVVRAGQTSVTVTSNPASRVPRTLTTSISASLGGNTASATLTVQR